MKLDQSGRRGKADTLANAHAATVKTKTGGGAGYTRNAADPPDSFDEWLDQRLHLLYRAVINEPIPPEMLDLLKNPNKTK
ncbi:MAG TPA: hypothetical protein VF342_02865 [Alphaproteobacteria bacterium]